MAEVLSRGQQLLHHEVNLQGHEARAAAVEAVDHQGHPGGGKGRGGGGGGTGDSDVKSIKAVI